jgi:hypothetical protein
VRRAWFYFEPAGVKGDTMFVLLSIVASVVALGFFSIIVSVFKSGSETRGHQKTSLDLEFNEFASN